MIPARKELLTYVDLFLKANLHDWMSDEEKVRCIDFAEWLLPQLLNKPDVIGWQEFDEHKFIDKQRYVLKFGGSIIVEFTYEETHHKEMFIEQKPKFIHIHA